MGNVAPRSRTTGHPVWKGDGDPGRWGAGDEDAAPLCAMRNFRSLVPFFCLKDDIFANCHHNNNQIRVNLFANSRRKWCQLPQLPALTEKQLYRWFGIIKLIAFLVLVLVLVSV